MATVTNITTKTTNAIKNTNTMCSKGEERREGE
jgi:hypothetical protein